MFLEKKGMISHAKISNMKLIGFHNLVVQRCFPKKRPPPIQLLCDSAEIDVVQNQTTSANETGPNQTRF